MHHLLEEQAKIAPNSKAIIHGKNTLTYSSLNMRANQVEQWLISKDIGIGERVLLYSQNNDWLVAALFGIIKLGGIAVPVHPKTPPETFSFIIKDCSPSAIIGNLDLIMPYYAKVDDEGIPVLFISSDSFPVAKGENPSLWDMLSSLPADIPNVVISPDDLALIIYTSGSTKNPRGVMCPHRQVIFSTFAINSILKNSSKDVILCGLPMSFDYGLYQIFLTFQAGGMLILEKDFTFIPGIPRLLKQYNVTGFPGVPTLFATLLRSRMLERVHLPSLRYITSTGDHFSPSYIKKLQDILPKISIISMYGLTECKRVSIMPPELLTDFPLSVGFPLPNTQVLIIDENGKECPTGLEGELVVQGPHVMRGYWNNPSETKLKFRKDETSGISCLYTGDIFYKDNNGLLYFVSRKDYFIKSRGEKISPAEVESFLCGLDGVLEAGVVGVPDALLGESVWTFISVSNIISTDKKEIMNKCVQSLSPASCPDKIILSESPLPKTQNQKLDRIKLRKIAIDMKANYMGVNHAR